MTLSIWCDKCHVRFQVSEFDPETRLCARCSGVEPVLFFPLSEEERASRITIDVTLSARRTITREDVKTDAEWRTLLQAEENWDGKGDDPFDRFIDDMGLGYDTDITDVTVWVTAGKPRTRPTEEIQVAGGLL